MSGRLSEGQASALRNLRAKQKGEDVGFINIADARALVDLGFAQRSREGWDITKEGVAALEED